MPNHRMNAVDMHVSECSSYASIVMTHLETQQDSVFVTPQADSSWTLLNSFNSIFNLMDAALWWPSRNVIVVLISKLKTKESMVSMVSKMRCQCIVYCCKGRNIAYHGARLVSTDIEKEEERQRSTQEPVRAFKVTCDSTQRSLIKTQVLHLHTIPRHSTLFSKW